MSSFDEFLDALHTEGHVDSGGTFTLSREKALEKFAAFQFADPSEWILRLAQSAVLSGSACFAVVFEENGVTVSFDPSPAWTYEAVEAALLNPEQPAMACLEPFRRALWNSWLHQGCSFELQIAQQNRALVGVGGQIHYRDVMCGQNLLRISHRKAENGFSWLFDGSKNDGLGAILRQRAWLSPLKQTIGGSVLSLIAGRLESADGSMRDIASLSSLSGPLPNIPPPSRQPYPKRVAARIGPVIKEYPPLLDSSVIVELGYYWSMTTGRVKESEDLIGWVQDGVLLNFEPLFGFPKRGLTVRAFLSAEGLACDLSGTRVIDSPEKQRRVAWVEAEIARTLKPASMISFPKPGLSLTKVAYCGFVAVMGGGAGLLCQSLLTGTFCGLVTAVFSSPMLLLKDMSLGLNQRVESDMDILNSQLQGWRESRPPS